MRRSCARAETEGQLLHMHAPHKGKMVLRSTRSHRKRLSNCSLSLSPFLPSLLFTSGHAQPSSVHSPKTQRHPGGEPTRASRVERRTGSQARAETREAEPLAEERVRENGEISRRPPLSVSSVIQENPFHVHNE